LQVIKSLRNVKFLCCYTTIEAAAIRRFLLVSGKCILKLFLNGESAIFKKARHREKIAFLIVATSLFLFSIK